MKRNLNKAILPLASLLTAAAYADWYDGGSSGSVSGTGSYCYVYGGGGTSVSGPQGQYCDGDATLETAYSCQDDYNWSFSYEGGGGGSGGSSGFGSWVNAWFSLDYNAGHYEGHADVDLGGVGAWAVAYEGA
jgi:hypothetical protein